MDLREQAGERETATAGEVQRIELRGFSYADRGVVLPALTEAVASSGCWLQERRAVSFSRVEFLFEMQMRSALEVYSALIGAGLELTQASHVEMTGLCTLRRHNTLRRMGTGGLGKTVSLRLEVSFLEESDMGNGAGES